MAKETWHNGSTSLYDPEALPDKRWAIYSKHPTFHKIIGKLDISFYSTIGYSEMVDYLNAKHDLSSAKLDRVNSAALQTHLSSLPLSRLSTCLDCKNDTWLDSNVPQLM